MSAGGPLLNNAILGAGQTPESEAPETIGRGKAASSAFEYGHDEHDPSQQILGAHTQTNAADGLIWRSPVGFGPMPGPRQNFLGNPPDAYQSSYKSVSLRMTTSRALLENLLPRRDVLRFASPGALVEMTWKFQSNHNVSWLGGRDYAHFSLYFHGVECSTPDGNALVGDFLAIMLEDKADPIITGRDELGFPKLACDLAIKEGVSAKHITVRASWDGFEFAQLCLNDPRFKDIVRGVSNDAPAQKPCEPPTQPHAGLLVHRYVPAVGQADQADADYIACVPPVKAEEKPTVEDLWVSKDASITLDRGDWKRLPTLHHIIDRLEELPNLGTVEATIAQGKGIGNHKGIYRVR